MNKKLLSGLGLLVFGLASIFIYMSDYKEYAILTILCTVIMLIMLISEIKQSATTDNYDKKLKNILKVYDSVLAYTDDYEGLKEKDYVKVKDIEDLINIQEECKKPIYSYASKDSNAFTLIDNNIVSYYILKRNDSVVDPIDAFISNEKKKQNKRKNDTSFLDDITKTTLLKVGDNKTYKISPVRKKKKIEEDAEIL